MEFTHITPKDAGRYYCTAENVHGNVTKVAEVIVNRNEITDNLPSQQSRVQEVVEGETISLYCSSPYEGGSHHVSFSIDEIYNVVSSGIKAKFKKQIKLNARESRVGTKKIY